MLIDIDFYDKPQQENTKAETWNGGLTLTLKADPMSGREEYTLDVATPVGETGIYWAKALDNFLESYSDYRIIQEYQRGSTFQERLAHLREWGDSYGVADNLDQIKTHLSRYWFEADKTFVLALGLVKKIDQPDDGGWRWHKWGTYIGDQDPQYEYLADEPDIDEVLLFEFIEVVPQKQKLRRNPNRDKLYQIDTFNPEKPYIHGGICFDPQHGSGANGNTRDVNNAGFVVFISPQTFLELAYKLEHFDKSRDFFVETLPKVDWCIAPETLSLQPLGFNPWGDKEPDNSQWEVSAHEGRHRALALQDLGLRLIPVYVFPYMKRSKNIDYAFIQTINQLKNESKDDWVSLEATFYIIDKKVYVCADSQEDANRQAENWIRPLTIKALKQKTSYQDFRGETSYRYWSRPDPDQSFRR